MRTFLAFTAGAIVGGLVAGYFVTKKYETLVNEEIDSVKEAFKRRSEQKEETSKETKEEESDKEMIDIPLGPTVEEIVTEYGGDRFEETEKFKQKQKEELEKRAASVPYEIDSYDFGEEDHDTMFCTYYKDGYLVDDYDKPIDDIDETVGVDFFRHFTDTKTTIYIRNDRLGIDYEILKVNENYTSERVDE